MTETEATTIVGMLASAHPAWKASEATVALWVDLLADLPYDQCRQATRRLLATDSGWPSIAKVRRATADILGLLPPDTDVACRQFLDRAAGRSNQTHPLVDDTVLSLGGWRHVRTATNVSVLLGQFRSLYETAAVRETGQILAAGALLEQPVRRQLPQ